MESVRVFVPPVHLQPAFFRISLRLKLWSLAAWSPASFTAKSRDEAFKISQVSSVATLKFEFDYQFMYII